MSMYVHVHPRDILGLPAHTGWHPHKGRHTYIVFLPIQVTLVELRSVANGAAEKQLCCGTILRVPIFSRYLYDDPWLRHPIWTGKNTLYVLRV